MTSALVKALSILVCLIVLVKSTNGLSCLPCEPDIHCPRGNLTEYDCPFGVVKDICHCCDTCAKGQGEKCGGRWDMYGTCGLDYTCARNDIPASSHYILPGTCA